MTKGEQSRLSAWRMRLLQQAADDGNVARVCRRFGISRKSFYKWKRRRAEHGDIGLCDRARAPHGSPRATAREVVSKILYLRQHYATRSSTGTRIAASPRLTTAAGVRTGRPIDSPRPSKRRSSV